MKKHNWPHRLGAALLVLVMLIAMFPSANASLALGWELIDRPVRLAEGVTLTTGKLWSDSKQDLRTEYYINYIPGGLVKPMVYYGEHVANWDTLTDSAAILEEQGLRVIAGINGGFFNSNGTAVGILYSGGEMKAMDSYNAYMLGFRKDGSAFVDDSTLTLEASWQVGEKEYTKRMSGINCYRIPENGHSASGLYLYSPDYWEVVRENTETHSVSVMVQPVEDTGISMNSTVEMVVLSAPVDSRDPEQTYVDEIPEGCFMLYANCIENDSLLNNLLALEEGQTVTISLTGGSEDWADAEYGLTALYMLVEDGEVSDQVEKLSESFNPYTAVGIRKDGSLLFYAIDGRRPGHSVGAQYRQVAERLIELGCVTAVALDGGGSTTVGATAPGGDVFTLENTPSDGKQRNVSSCIFLVADADTPAVGAPGYYVEADNQVVFTGSSTHLKASAYDSFGAPALWLGEPVWLAEGGTVVRYDPPTPTPEESEDPEESTDPDATPDPDASPDPSESAEPEESGDPQADPQNYGPRELISDPAPEDTETPDPAESEEPGEGDPAESADPAESKEPGESSDPSESGEPAESEEPSESEEPTESEEPSESEEPTDSPEPSESPAPSKEPVVPVTYEAIYTAGDEPGDYQVSASGNSIPIKVVDTLTGLTMRREDGLPLQSTLKVSPGETLDFTMRPIWKGLLVAMDDTDAAWTADEAIGTIDAAGRFTAVGVNATGDISVTVGDQTATIHVQVDRGDPFMDVDSSHWASEYITEIYQAGMATGIQEPDGSFTFHPNYKMSRLELLVMVSHMLGEDTSRFADVELPFADAEEVPDWAMADVKAMYALGVINGSVRADGLYLDGRGLITREMAMTMMGKVLVSDTAADLSIFEDGDTVSEWAKTFVENMVALGVVNGAYGRLNPGGSLTRAEGAALIVRSAVLERKQLSLIPELQEGDPDPSDTGDGQGDDPTDSSAEPTEPVPGETEPGPEESDPGAESTEPMPAETEPGPEESDPGAEPTDPMPGETEPGPEESDPGAESTDPNQENSDSGGDPAASNSGAEPGPAESEPGPEESDPGAEPTEPIPGA